VFQTSPDKNETQTFQGIATLNTHLREPRVKPNLLTNIVLED